MDERDARAGRPALLARLWGLVRNNLRLVLVVVCGAVFLALLEDVLDGELMKLDRAAYWLVVQHMRADRLTPIMESFSALATPVTLLVLLLAVAAFAPGRRPGLCCAANLGLVVLLNQVLKVIIQRPRPEGFRLATAGGFSFPSGHSMVAMAFFGLLVWFVWHYERDRRMRLGLCAAFLLVIVMVGSAACTWASTTRPTSSRASACRSCGWPSIRASPCRSSSRTSEAPSGEGASVSCACGFMEPASVLGGVSPRLWRYLLARAATASADICHERPFL